MILPASKEEGKKLKKRCEYPLLNFGLFLSFKPKLCPLDLFFHWRIGVIQQVR